MNCSIEGCDREGFPIKINEKTYYHCEQCHQAFKSGMALGIMMGEMMALDEEAEE